MCGSGDKAMSDNLERVPTLNDRYVYSAVIKRVIDGDTLVCDIDLGCGVWLRDESCRLFGINAPERGTVEGVRAKEYMEFITHTTKPAIIRTHKDRREKYGRWLVEVWQDGLSVAQRMVDQGHAKQKEY
jgi:micrococcal nuclease